MMKKLFGIYKYLMLFVLLLSLNVGSASAENTPTSLVRLSGHIPEHAISHAVSVEKLGADVHLPITFTLPLRNQQELEELIHCIYDPSDTKHHGKYLSTKEFIDRFAPTEEDYNKVIDYAKELGLKIHATHPNRLLLNVAGSVGSVETAFKLSLHQYELPSGRKFYAPSDQPEVPASIASLITGIVGLDNHAVWRPFHKIKETTSIEGSPLLFAGPGGGLSPSDIAKAYNLSSLPVNGAGQTVALLQLATYEANDINTYASQFGLPTPKLHNIVVDGGAASDPDGNGEVTLDIELVLSMAPQAQVYVYEGPNSGQGVLDTYSKIASDNIAKQVSTSWGLGEDLIDTQTHQTQNAIFMQMAAQGQSMFAAAGDDGAYDDYRVNSSMSLVVDDPASQPYVTGVGGTRLNVNASSGTYISESVWNDGLGSSGGGGVSTVWPIPAWQKNVSSSSSNTNRNVPDVCLNADPNTGYSIYYQGQWTIFGGTSCAAPLWAGYTALVNQQLAAAQKSPVGFINPALYAIGQGQSYHSNFNDVTTGDNLHYQAGAGYDNATGWGSFNGTNLFVTLTNSTPVNPPSPPTTTPALNFTMQQTTLYFSKGKIGTYTIQASNTGKGATTGPVTLTVNIPSGLTFDSYCGSGWVVKNSNNKLIFTESAILSPGASFPTITLNFRVSSNAPSSVSTVAILSGGGSASSTVAPTTTIK